MTREIMNRIRTMAAFALFVILVMETANFIVSRNYPAIPILLAVMACSGCLLFRLTEE